MTIIAGHPFLTDFQTTQLINRLNTTTDLAITALSSQQVYIFSKDLAEHDYKKAIDLLNHGDDVAMQQAQDGQLQVMVSPRFGTISPWASKATDIFNNCDVNIDRVERVVVYTLTASKPLPAKLAHDIEMMLYAQYLYLLVIYTNEKNIVY